MYMWNLINSTEVLQSPAKVTLKNPYIAVYQEQIRKEHLVQNNIYYNIKYKISRTKCTNDMQGLYTENYDYYWEKFRSAIYTMLMNYEVQFCSTVSKLME